MKSDFQPGPQTDNVCAICPYCGKEYGGARDWATETPENRECSRCNRTFAVWAAYYPTFHTAPVEKEPLHTLKELSRMAAEKNNGRCRIDLTVWSDDTISVSQRVLLLDESKYGCREEEVRTPRNSYPITLEGLQQMVLELNRTPWETAQAQPQEKKIV